MYNKYTLKKDYSFKYFHKCKKTNDNTLLHNHNSVSFENDNLYTKFIKIAKSSYGRKFLPIKIVSVYILIGVFWVIITDFCLLHFIGDINLFIKYKNLKGLIYVIFTGIILYYFITLHVKSLNKSSNELKLSEERYRLAVNASTDVIWDFNYKTNEFFFSPNIKKLLQIPDGEEYNDYIYFCNLIPKYDQVKINKIVNEQVQKKQTYYEIIYRIRAKNNKLKWVFCKAQILYDENNLVSRRTGTLTDITHYHKRESLYKNSYLKNKSLLIEAIKYDKLKTEFVSNMSHELRTPLNIIHSTLQLLESKYSDESTKRYIQIGEKNCNRLLRLINNLIDISIINAGDLELNLQNYDIVNLVEDTAFSVSHYAQNKNISIIFDTEIEEKIIACDVDMVERVILNILSNSIKFSNNDSDIWVVVKDNGNKVSISVKDNGIGIPKEKLNVIFERLTQVDGSSTRHYEGSGIGLYLVKSIIDMHGGSIYVSSELGKGSEFVIELPIKLIDDTTIKNKTSASKKINIVGVELSDIQ